MAKPSIKNGVRIVVTGGPSSGKTTLLDRLKAKGYITMPEPAKTMIDEQLQNGADLEKLRSDPAKFIALALEKSIEIEESAPKGKTVFFDRAIADCVAYLKFYNLPSKSVETMSRNRYDKVFFMEQLPIYANDYHRNEDKETAAKLSDATFKAYRDLGYEVIRLPPVSVDERATMLLSHM